jgi:hypothetical protein
MRLISVKPNLPLFSFTVYCGIELPVYMRISSPFNPLLVAVR